MTGPPPCPPPPAGEGEESPFQTVWWPTRTPATSVMALWGPVGRNPTGIPKSRALPLARGGLDSVVMSEFFQLELRVHLNVPVAVAMGPHPDEVVDGPGGKEHANRQQVRGLLLRQRDDAANEPDE